MQLCCLQRPLLKGEYEGTVVNVMLTFLHISLNSSDSNSPLLSLKTLFRLPNILIHECKNFLIAVDFTLFLIIFFFLSLYSQLNYFLSHAELDKGVL